MQIDIKTSTIQHSNQYTVRIGKSLGGIALGGFMGMGVGLLAGELTEGGIARVFDVWAGRGDTWVRIEAMMAYVGAVIGMALTMWLTKRRRS